MIIPIVCSEGALLLKDNLASYWWFYKKVPIRKWFEFNREGSLFHRTFFVRWRSIKVAFLISSWEYTNFKMSRTTSQKEFLQFRFCEYVSDVGGFSVSITLLRELQALLAHDSWHSTTYDDTRDFGCSGKFQWKTRQFPYRKSKHNILGREVTVFEKVSFMSLCL